MKQAAERCADILEGKLATEVEDYQTTSMKWMQLAMHFNEWSKDKLWAAMVEMSELLATGGES